MRLDAPKGTEPNILRAANRIALTLGFGLAAVITALTGPTLMAAVPVLAVVFIIGQGSANTEALGDDRPFTDEETTDPDAGVTN
ncbi:hypothetical protein [Halorussus marinus]|uniref:hypothetical protein n=1 Tax=Halorussus marinus TaxID=2505976 RepID=UPI001091E255|nr:hypothetical protein [Halorussus marinus]